MIYHWWSQSPVEVWKDLENPVILSIATARNFNKSLEICVLDASDHDNIWGEYPKALDFRVRRCVPVVPLVSPERTTDWAYRMCSRIFEVPRFFETLNADVCLFCDSDIFWTSNPAVLGGDLEYFCALKHNTGLFYYSRDSTAARRFLREWQKTIVKMIVLPDFQETIWQTYLRGSLIDEAAYRHLTYMKPEFSSPLCHYLSHADNYVGARFDEYNKDAKNYHLMKCDFMQKKGDFAFLVREFRDSIRSSMPEDLYRPLERGIPVVTNLCSLSKFVGDLRPGWEVKLNSA